MKEIWVKFKQLLGCLSFGSTDLPLGERGERVAVRFLRRSKIKVIERNVRFHEGEIDVVAVDDRTVVFVEVKTRSSRTKGEPWEAVDRTKQQRIIDAADVYLQREGLQEQKVRFDIVSIYWPPEKKIPEIEHLKDAFVDSDRVILR